ncbi:MAG: sulfur carrier protein ThiS [Desulfobulbaceae bacterium]
MVITINGEQERIEADSLTITELLERRNVESPDMVSVQLNGEFIDRSQYPETRLGDGDTVDFLYFMGGGSSR